MEERLSQQGAVTPRGEDDDLLREAFALVSVVADAGLLPALVTPPTLRGRAREDRVAMHQYLMRLRRACAELKAVQDLQALKDSMREKLGLEAATRVSGYGLTAQELSRMQELVAHMRTLALHLLDSREPYELRLHNRMARLAQALQASMPDFDPIWGLVADIRIAVVKVGVDAHPLYASLSALRHLAWQAQARCEGINTADCRRQLHGLELDGE